MIDRLLDYLFGFILIVLFVLIADNTERIWMAAALGLGIIAVLVTFFNNTLTIDGAGAALVTGVAAMGLWAWTGAGLLLFFFFSSYGLATRLAHNERHWETGSAESMNHDTVKAAGRGFSERRTGIQVWANAFWFVLFLVVFFLLDERWAAVSAAAALAAATSDTWSSLVGEHLSPNARMITTFKKVPPGTDGGITYPGILAGFAGALTFTVLFLLLSFSLDIRALWIILVSGFSGCIMDSYLGAIFQAHDMPGRWLDDSKTGTVSRFIRQCIPDNNGVNFLSTGFAAILALILY